MIKQQFNQRINSTRTIMYILCLIMLIFLIEPIKKLLHVSICICMHLNVRVYVSIILNIYNMCRVLRRIVKESGWEGKGSRGSGNGYWRGRMGVVVVV